MQGAELWTAQLLQLDTGGNVIGMFKEGEIPAEGLWEIKSVPEGGYFLLISAANGERWFNQHLAIDSNTPPLFVTIPRVEVRGELTFGDVPLPAQLLFGGRNEALKVALAADEEGEFEGVLPREGLWNVEVVAEYPAIRRKVQVEVTDGEEIEISIPDTTVRGRVVDEQNRSVEQAIVRIMSMSQPGMTTDVYTDAEGGFEVVGLPPGRTTFVAEDVGQYSDQQEVHLDEKQVAPEVELILRRTLKLKGRVVGANGEGVVGARIKALSAEVLNRPVFMVISEADGGFELDLPAITKNIVLNVGAPGFGFRTLQVPAREESLVIPVARESGTLVVELPESLDRSLWDAPQIAIVHNLGYAGLYFLQDWARFQGQEQDGSEKRYVIPAMEPGDYSACLVRFQQLPAFIAGNRSNVRCDHGNLSPFGELELSVPVTAALDQR